MVFVSVYMYVTFINTLKQEMSRPNTAPFLCVFSAPADEIKIIYIDGTVVFIPVSVCLATSET